ncbi:MAG TPA: Rrf2 family transcriptional regulator [Streptomyces sp.]|nr:Rrf2 family transcriptional regulator [Streptomyces sp.]
MSANSKLTVALHALAWVGLYQSRGHEVATSEQIADSASTNPVVIRRLLGELRAAGLVRAQRGAGAGWMLERGLEEISLLDVYDAIGAGPLFGMHRAEPNQDCVVGAGIQPALEGVYGRLDRTLRAELAATTVADVLKDTLAPR